MSLWLAYRLAMLCKCVCNKKHWMRKSRRFCFSW